MKNSTKRGYNTLWSHIAAHGLQVGHAYLEDNLELSNKVVSGIILQLPLISSDIWNFLILLKVSHIDKVINILYAYKMRLRKFCYRIKIV